MTGGKGKQFYAAWTWSLKQVMAKYKIKWVIFVCLANEFVFLHEDMWWEW